MRFVAFSIIRICFSIMFISQWRLEIPAFCLKFWLPWYYWNWTLSPCWFTVLVDIDTGLHTGCSTVLACDVLWWNKSGFCTLKHAFIILWANSSQHYCPISLYKVSEAWYHLNQDKKCVELVQSLLPLGFDSLILLSRNHLAVGWLLFSLDTLI